MSEEDQGRRGIVYQSEEERKAAQRKILSEKFGLKIESDDEETNVAMTFTENRGDHGPTDEFTAHGEETELSQVATAKTPTFDKFFADKSSDVSLKQSDTSATPSACEWSPLKVMNVEYEDAVLNVTQRDLAPVGRHIPKREGVYFYEGLQSSDDELSETEKELRVTPITVYNSAINSYNGRRIAVNSNLITYAVKNHIRVLSRFTASKELLKGHKDEVIDLEFANFQEQVSNWNSGIVVLISSGKEGCVFVWFVEVDNEDSFHCVGHLVYEHPERNIGNFFHRVAFHGEEKHCKIAVADAKTPRIFVIVTSNITKRLQNEPAAFTAVYEEDEPMICLEQRNLDSEADHMNDLIFKDADHLLSADSYGNLYFWCISSRTLLLQFTHSQVPEPIACLGLLRSDPIDDMIVVIGSCGRTIELFELRNNETELNKWKFVLSQKIALEIPKVNDASVACCIDNQSEFLLVTNSAMKEVIAVHFSREKKFYADFVSRFPVRYPILSFCVTRCGRKIRYVNDDDNWEGSEVILVEEIGIWCVQSKSIQYLHLYADKCRPPSTFQENETLDQSSSLAPHRDEETIRMEQELDDSYEGSKKTSETVYKLSSVSEPEEKANTAVEERSDIHINRQSVFKSKLDNTGATGYPRKKSAGSVTRILTKQEASSQSGNTKQFQPVTILKKPSMESETKKESGPPNMDVYSTPSQQPQQGLAENVNITRRVSSNPSFVERNTFSEEFSKFKQQVLEEIEVASRRNFERYAEQLETERAQRERLEREKLERLLEAVSDTINHRLEQFVNSSMENEFEETVVPRLSETVAETLERWTGSSKFEQLVNHLLEAQFGQTLDSTVRKSCEELFESRLVPAFEAACREMLKQVDSAVVTGFQQQLDLLLKRDFFDPLSTLQDRISSALENLKVQSFEPRGESIETAQEDPQNVRVSKEVLQSQISELLSQENYEGAFLLALGASNLDIVEWLCEKLDCHVLFQADEPPLSQVTLLSLIQQLGFDLQRQTEMKVEWLKESIMLLEPTDEMIQDYLSDILSMLVQNLESLLESGIRNSQYALSTQLQRNIKVLLHICRSLESNS